MAPKKLVPVEKPKPPFGRDRLSYKVELDAAGLKPKPPIDVPNPPIVVPNPLLCIEFKTLLNEVSTIQDLLS